MKVTYFHAAALTILMQVQVQVNAKTAEEQKVERLLVTAQKRTQNIQDVPISINLIDRDQLKQISVLDLDDLALQVPGLHQSSSQTINNNISLRGIGSNDFGLSTEDSVPVYIDGIYAGDGINIIGELQDIQSIEVLKGPQGSLFGRNAIAGAINVITPEPLDSKEAELSLSIGNFNLSQFRGIANLPLMEDRLLLRLSGSATNRDGWQENFDPLRADTQAGFALDKQLLRAKLQFTVSDHMTLEWHADWKRNTGTTGRYNAVGGQLVDLLSFAGLLQPSTSEIGAQVSVNGNGFFALDTSNPLQPIPILNGPQGTPLDNDINRKTYSHSLKLDWNLSNNMNLVATSSYRKYSSVLSEDNDGTEYLFINATGRVDNKETSQEFRLTGQNNNVDWLVGISGYQFNVNGQVDDEIGALLLGFPFRETAIVEVDTDSVAVFGDAIWKVNEKTRLTLGGRWSYDKKSQAIKNPQEFGLLFASPNQFIDEQGTPAPQLADGKDSWNDFSPRLVLDYRLQSDVLLFTGITQGYKSGGFNSFPTVNTDPTSGFFGTVPFGSTTSFDKEKITSFESGIKSQFGDELRLNASAFVYQFDDLQFQVIDGPVVRANNAAKASGRGVDIELDYQPTTDLTLQAKASWLDATYDRDVIESNGNVLVRDGQTLAYAPRFSGNLMLDYSKNIGSGEIRTFISYAYTGSRAHSAISESEIYRENGFGIVNVRFGYQPSGSKLQIVFWCKNATNEVYLNRIGGLADDFGVIAALRSEPRTWGVELRFEL